MRNGFEVKSASTEDEVGRVAEFIESIFGGGRDYIAGHPDVRLPGAVRYVAHKGKVVSAHVLERMDLALGDGRAKAARIEYVGTAEAYRKQGLCRWLIEDSLRLLRADGTQLAVILGEPLFRRLGFEYCIPTYEQGRPVFSPPGSAVIPTAALETCRSSAEVRNMRPDDLPAIAALHEGGNPKGNLSRRRPMEYWEYLVREKGLDNYRVIQSERDLTGYFRIEASTGDVRLHEVAAVTEDACQGILRSAFEAARDHGAGLLIVHCPHQSTFGSHLRQRGAAEYSPFADRLTSLQLKILDLPGCLRLLTADLSRRVERSELAGCQAKYQFATEDDRVVVRTGKGKVAVTEDAAQARRISIPSRTMAQLVCGFGTFRHEAEWHPPAEEARLLEVLFPPGEPYWHVDDL